MPSKRTYDVVVAGAGIIGASIAWHACRLGLDTAILDATGPSAGASGASDGAVSLASKKPGVLAALAGRSLDYCRQLAEPGGVLEGAFSQRPSFLFASTAAEQQALDRLAVMLSDPELPVTITRDGPARSSAIAGLGKPVSRVVELRGEGHMPGYQAVRAFVASSKAETIWPCRLQAFEATANGVVLTTTLGEIRAGRLILAAGLHCASLLPELPLFARSGQLIVTDRATGAGWAGLPGPLTSAAYLLDKSAHKCAPVQAPVVIDPLGTGQLSIGSSREDHGTSAHTDFHTVRRILASGVACLPALSMARIVRVFAGVRTACSDGFPVVGPLPGTPRVIAATGFEDDGICLAPLIGQQVAKLLVGEGVLAGIGALSPARFARTLVAV